jgi:DNA topoisomerase-1
VIVESPAKAKTIEGFLGDGYVVRSSVGHIRDLPAKASDLPEGKRETHGRLAGIDPDDHFDVHYRIVPGKSKVVQELRSALKGADELILATDEDREGEAIGWHVLDVLKPKVPVKRMVFHEITRTAIGEALQSPRDLDMHLVEAQEARRVLDRLVGYETSPVLWRKIGKQAPSAGRVQSVAVRLIVDRERARMRFVAASFHDIVGRFEALDVVFPAALVEVDGTRVAEGRDFADDTGQVRDGRDVVVLDHAAATSLADRLAGAAFAVESLESKPTRESPRAPFTTSTLQQEAARKLRFGASKTMAVAQRLYERGHITYMRTDSTNLSEQAITAARHEILHRYGEAYLPDAPRTYRSRVKNAQEAHEAIRPAGERIQSPDDVRADLDGDEQRLYELIWMRTLASQMNDARGRQVTLRVAATSSVGERAVFRAGGKTYDFLGWRVAYVEDVDEGDDVEAEAVLPAVVAGAAVGCAGLEVQAHETRPPARFTEASLVKELEQRGIGRPSTYAAVVETIQAREYVWRKGSALVPAWTAFAVVQLLERHFAHLVDYGFTATMEESLDAIARGEAQKDKWLDAFYFGNGQAGLRELVSDDHLADIDPRAVSTVTIGLLDGAEVVVRVGRYGPFVQVGDATASLPPDLAPDELTPAAAAELVSRQADGPRELGSDPDTGLPVYVTSGRFGPYVQLGDQEPGSKRKPKRASLFASMGPETLTLEQALALLRLPRVVGVDEDGVEIAAANGRYGPYIKRGSDTRSLESEEQLLSIDRDQALALLAQPKRARGRQARPPIAELGEHPDTGAAVRVLDGRYGPYVTDGSVNATVPRGSDPASLTLDDAVALLRARAADPRPARRVAKRATKSGKAAKRSAKPSAKRTKSTKSTGRAPTKASDAPATESAPVVPDRP